MQTIQTTSHVGPDGILSLSLPVGVTNADLEVMIALRVVTSVEGGAIGDEREWCRRVLSTAGSIQDESFFRAVEDPQFTAEQHAEWRTFIAETAGAWKGEPLRRPT